MKADYKELDHQRARRQHCMQIRKTKTQPKAQMLFFWTVHSTFLSRPIKLATYKDVFMNPSLGKYFVTLYFLLFKYLDCEAAATELAICLPMCNTGATDPRFSTGCAAAGRTHIVLKVNAVIWLTQAMWEILFWVSTWQHMTWHDRGNDSSYCLNNVLDTGHPLNCHNIRTNYHLC